MLSIYITDCPPGKLLKLIKTEQQVTLRVFRTMSSTSPEDFVIEPVTPPDLPRLLEIYTSSFSAFPAQAILLPATIPHSALEEWFIANNLHQLKRPELRYFKIVNTKTNIIAGFVRWGLPHDPKQAEPFNYAPRPEGANNDFGSAKFGAMGVGQQKYVDWKEMYGMSLRM